MNPYRGTVVKSTNSSILNNVKQTRLYLITFLLIFIGVSLLLLIGAVSAWGDLKAISFDNLQHLAAEPLDTLRCPAMISSSETGTISATFSNVTNLSTTIDTRVVLTNGSISETKSIDDEILLGPEEFQELTWSVNAQNAMENHFILVRVHQLAIASQPLKNASCGIFVFDLPFLTGQQLILILMSLAALFSIGGILTFALTNKPGGWKNPGINRILIFITISFLFSLGGLLGSWGFALFILVIWLMLVIELLWYFLNSARQSMGEKEKTG